MKVWKAMVISWPCDRAFTYENQNLSFLETTQPFLTKFCMEAFSYKEMKIHEHDAGHMTKMVAMPIWEKTLQKSSSSEREDRFPRNLVWALGTQAHHSLFKWWPWVDLNLVYGKVKFGKMGFSIEKLKIEDFQKLLQPVTWSL